MCDLERLTRTPGFGILLYKMEIARVPFLSGFGNELLRNKRQPQRDFTGGPVVNALELHASNASMQGDVGSISGLGTKIPHAPQQDKQTNKNPQQQQQQNSALIKTLNVSTDSFWGFPGGASGKEPTCQCIRGAGSIPGLGRSPGEGHGNALQYSCLENPTDRGASRAMAHRVTESDTTEVT